MCSLGEYEEGKNACKMMYVDVIKDITKLINSGDQKHDHADYCQCEVTSAQLQ